MKNINALLDEFNIAGLETILLMPTAVIAGMPLPDLENNRSIDVSAIDISEPYEKWFLLVHTKDTGVLNEDTEISDHGTVYKYSIECIVPKHYAFRENQFDELSQLEHLVIAKDNNGALKILGHVNDLMDKKGCEFRWKFSTGTSSKDRNGYKITLTLQTSQKSQPVTGFDSLAISSDFFNI